MMKMRTLAALMLGALTAGAAHAAESGTADFSADIEAHSAMKCGIEIGVDDPLVAVATYQKPAEGQKLGKLVFTKEGVATLTAKATGHTSCTLDNYVLTANEPSYLMADHNAAAVTKNGLEWSMDFSPAGLVMKKAGSVMKFDGLNIGLRVGKDNGIWSTGLMGSTRSEHATGNFTSQSSAGKYTKSNVNLPLHATATLLSGGQDADYGPEYLVAGLGGRTWQGTYRPVGGADEVSIQFAAVIAQHPWDPTTNELSAVRLEDGEEITYSAVLTATQL